jgi:hypothetical protein
LPEKSGGALATDASTVTCRDPRSGARSTSNILSPGNMAVFNPRTEEWDIHFSLAIGAHIPQGIAIEGLTPIGQATVQVLGLNDEMRQLIRYELWIEGLYTVATA